MSYTLSHPHAYYESRTETKRQSAISRFFQWAAAQDAEYHVAWVGISVTAMAAVFFPMTMTVILLNGASFGLIVTAMISLAWVVVANLAALPTKYTIPFFLLGALADIVVIGVSLMHIV